GLAILPPPAVAAQAERVLLEELAVDSAEAGRARLAVELVQLGLRVEQVHMARPADHEQEDAPLRPRREVAGLRRQRIGRRGPLGPRLALEQVGQAQQAEAAAHELQELAAAARQEGLGAGAASCGARCNHGPWFSVMAGP